MDSSLPIPSSSISSVTSSFASSILEGENIIGAIFSQNRSSACQGTSFIVLISHPAAYLTEARLRRIGWLCLTNVLISQTEYCLLAQGDRHMPEWLEYSSDWAYWVNPKTFRMPRLKKSVPLGVVLLVKTRDASENGRRFVSTDYFLVEQGGPKPITKVEVSKILARQLLEYAKANKMWPPHSEVKEIFDNGNVDIIYAPTDFDKFTLKLSEKQVGGNVSKFLDGLKEFTEEILWKVEPAKSARSTCKTCFLGIGKGELRIGEPSFFQEHLSYNWHHVHCIKSAMPPITPGQIKGFSELTKAQKEELEDLLE
ncbi:MAG: hypothetical protein EAX95_13325 [Candidatus Thorarchaeota archaeon]|nr:hypothetical protein [Candidatus Thorarchaeota archaeon]